LQDTCGTHYLQLPVGMFAIDTILTVFVFVFVVICERKEYQKLRSILLEGRDGLGIYLQHVSPDLSWKLSSDIIVL